MNYLQRVLSLKSKIKIWDTIKVKGSERFIGSAVGTTGLVGEV